MHPALMQTVPDGCGSPSVAAPTILLLLPWRVKVDEDRLSRKLLRGQERLLAAGRALPQFVIARTSALMAYHRADAVLRISIERVAGDESARRRATVRLSYVLEGRPTELGRRIPWATGMVEASASPFRQAGAAEAAWGRGPGETAYKTWASRPGVRQKVQRRVQYSRPEEALQAEAIEDGIVGIVRDVASA